MTILAYQLVIVLSLILVRGIAQSYLSVAAIAWTVYTFVAVFTSPLLILQLVTIWVTHALLSPRHARQRATRPATRSAGGSPSRNASPAPSLLYDAARTSGEFVGKVGKFVEDLNTHVRMTTAIQDATRELQLAVDLEQSCIDSAVAIEQQKYELADYLRKLGPEGAARYRETFDWLEDEEAEHHASPDPARLAREDVAPPDFNAVSADHTDPRVAHAIARTIDALRETREQFLTLTVQKDVWQDLARRAQLKETLLALGGANLWPGLEAAAARLPIARPAAPPSAATPGADTQPTASVTPAPTPSVQPARLGDILAAAWNDTVQKQAQARGIQHLIHFTRVENLPQILQHGIRPIADLEAGGIAFHANDGKRLDGRRNASSLSISHPNDKMFARYRWQDKEQDWAVLVLDPSILWTRKVAFCSHNAADKRISKTPLANLMHPPAFDAMFQAKEDLPARDETPLRPFDPTDVQAEVLVMDVVPPAVIRGVVFSHARCLPHYLGALGAIPASVGAEGKGYFGARAYARKAGWTH